MSLLDVTGLTKRFGGVTAVADVSFSVDEGDLVAVIGPNGAGKTTLINLVTGVLTADAGGVSYGDRDITGVPLHRLARQGITRSFQHPRVFRNMTVLDNVAVGAYQRQPVGMLVSGFKLPRAVRRERAALDAARRALAMVNLDCDPLMPADLLTTGQEKLLELARILATEPRIVFLDEPAAGLDDHETADLATTIAAVNRGGITVVLVEHNMQMVMSLAREIVVMDSGRKIANGPPERVRADPAVIEAYLGSPTPDLGASHA